MERLVAIWCPGLSTDGAEGREVRAFSQLLAIVGERCPFVEPIRRGVAVFPARGPRRFFGGEDAVAALVRADLAALCNEHETVLHIGVAEGLFAALCAAKQDAIVPPGRLHPFLASLPMASLRRSELAVLCQRLGIHTLGQFAQLSSDRVIERFGSDGAHCHRVARGEEGELLGIRDPSIQARLAALHDVPLPVVEPSFFGGTSHADRRAARAAIGLQERFGASFVCVVRDAQGHDPCDQATLVPFASKEGSGGSSDAPWPGRLPPPSPVVAHRAPLPVRLFDERAGSVLVDKRGILSAPPASWSSDEPRPLRRGIVAWAGPWPLVTRWWDVRRARARLQILDDHGEGALLGFEHRSWWLLGRYD